MTDEVQAEAEVKNKLYVGNIPYRMTSDDLKAAFEPVGEVVEAIVISDKMSGRSKGFGFVTMVDDAVAAKAVEEMDGKEYEGRPIRVSIARPLERREKRDFGGRRDSY